MILPRPEDAFHKLQLYRLLIAVLDNRKLAQNIYFKGGSCAAMLGWLDRFSLDLDFDLNPQANKDLLRKILTSVFKKLNFEIKEQNPKSLFFILRYQTRLPDGQAKFNLRNTLKLGIIDYQVQANDYQALFLAEIDRYAVCQTKETMVANKLVSLTDRFEKYKVIAGRDLYDIHYFLSRGYSYKKEVIEERKKTSVNKYLNELKEFIKEKVTTKIINEDLSYLLTYEKFRAIRKTIKTETVFLINDEIKRVEQNHFKLK